MSKLLETFLRGDLIVDCSKNRDGFERLMVCLEAQTDIIWSRGQQPTEVPYLSDEPYIWAYRWKDWNPKTGIHAMTHGSSVDYMHHVNPMAILLSCEDFLANIVEQDCTEAVSNELLVELLSTGFDDGGYTL